MRLDTKPVFFPRILTFETEKEWNNFIAYLNTTNVSNNEPDCDELNDFAWTLYTMILDGISKSQ